MTEQVPAITRRVSCHRNALAAEAPQTPLRELTAFLQTPNWI